MHRHGIYRAENFVYPALYLEAVHHIGVFYIQPVAIYTSISPNC